jgi:hypothetical protein
MNPLAFAVVLLAAAPAGEHPDSLNARASHVPVRAVRATAAISIDGILDEPVWQSDNAVTNFLQRDPVEGVPPSEKSEVRVAYDEDAIYIGARLYDSAPDSIIARLVRRDFSIPTDRFAVYLDPYHDRRSGYYFLINAAGTLLDGTVSNDGWEDGSWDGVWSARAHRDHQGWVAEMRIPFSQLRFTGGARPVWGINFRRVNQRRSEEDFLVYQPKNGSGFVSRFPELIGMENIGAGGSVEVMPYVTSKAAYQIHDASDPFNDGAVYKPNGGGDLRMAVGSKLTLNATVNPDFGQVEVDPAVVNLSDVESFFQEKRPFFVEGSSIFNCGNQGANDYWGFNWPEPTFFYSRRIGRAPQGNQFPNAVWNYINGPTVDFQDAPLGTRILGAAKVTGKLGPSVNFGTLHAITAKEEAQLSTGGHQWEQDIEPLTYYGVARSLKEFKNRQQGLGFMATYDARKIDDELLVKDVNKTALMTAMDGWFFLDKKQKWVVSGWSAFSNVTGSTDRITSLQTNSTHYFQRPDADHVEVDRNATSLSGFGSRYWLNKQSGQTFLNSALGFMTPGFDVNDMGFMSRADVVNGHFGGGRKWTQTTKSRKYQDVLGAVFGSSDFQGNLAGAGVWGGGRTEFINNYSWEYKFAYNPRTVSTRRTRGGPRMYNVPGYEAYEYFDTDGKSKLFYFIEAYDYFKPEANNSNYWYAYPGVEWKPVSNLTIRIGPGYEDNREDAQYVTTIADPTASATYGGRYIFANLNQKTYSGNLRLNAAFTPNISLQLFVQPLISVGDYTDFRELARPLSYDFLGPGAGSWTYDPATGLFDRDGAGAVFGPENRDFNIKSLRGNAVLRWEYMPGSTVYLVWTQERNDYDTTESAFGPSFRKLMDTEANNIFLAKLSYYFAL